MVFVLRLVADVEWLDSMAGNVAMIVSVQMMQSAEADCFELHESHALLNID